MTAPDVSRRLDAVASILPKLSETLLAMQGGDLAVSRKSNAFDLLTRADSFSEATLTGFIHEHFGDDLILAEEGGGAGPETDPDRYLWILDPIDGTTNYANRLPVWGVSIGLMRASKLVGALVAAPGLGLVYRAIRGEGATCNGKPIQVNGAAAMAEGIIATGFPYDRAKRAAPICRALENLLREAGGIRRMGAASLDFCFLADGRFAGYYEMGLKPWDYAAGSLIAQEAGATLTDLAGGPLDIFNSVGVVASNGRFHEALLSAAAPMIEAAKL